MRHRPAKDVLGVIGSQAAPSRFPDATVTRMDSAMPMIWRKK